MLAESGNVLAEAPTRCNIQPYLRRALGLEIAADHAPTHTTVMSPKRIGGEFLLAKWTAGHVGVVLPGDDRLLQDLALVPGSRQREPATRSLRLFYRWRVCHKLRELGEPLLKSADLHACSVDLAPPDPCEVFKVPTLGAVVVKVAVP